MNMDKETIESMNDGTAKMALSSLGLTLKKVDGEYTVNFKGGSVNTKYFTTDRIDAIYTGLAMINIKVEA